MTAATRTALGAGAFAALLTGSTGQGPAAGAPFPAPEPQCIAKLAGEMGVAPIIPPRPGTVANRILREEILDVYSPGRVSFLLKLQDDVTPYSTMSFMIEPGREVDLEVLLGEEEGSYEIQTDAGELTPAGERSWTWVAPSGPGHHVLRVRETESGETMRLRAFVLRPFSHAKRRLEGFLIGRYPEQPFQGKPVYSQPFGFIEVHPDMLDLDLTPHFRLRQFMSKQGGDWPQFVLIDTRLLLKLEMVLEEVNEMGLPAGTLSVLSGFRTPYYNARIGNTTTYSRHHYGDAADVFVDVDGNGLMDDLDDDGEISIRDAQLLAGIIDSKLNEAWYQPFIGGLGIYGSTPSHGPFVHLDVRGYKARW